MLVKGAPDVLTTNLVHLLHSVVCNSVWSFFFFNLSSHLFTLDLHWSLLTTFLYNDTTGVKQWSSELIARRIHTSTYLYVTPEYRESMKIRTANVWPWYLKWLEHSAWMRRLGVRVPLRSTHFLSQNFDTFTRTSVRVSKTNAVVRAQLTFQILTLLWK